jgi:uncharacterized membrane protein YciS (DUF1049 family)
VVSTARLLNENNSEKNKSIIFDNLITAVSTALDSLTEVMFWVGFIIAYMDSL